MSISTVMYGQNAKPSRRKCFESGVVSSRGDWQRPSKVLASIQINLESYDTYYTNIVLDLKKKKRYHHFYSERVGNDV
ncbi:hypothetical protein PV327_002676 [Microctonus hyperodae]|uniref:Uncharacterized protein n=1 Tax=Microctonus hyperodae TaxID=165561 RepID=A0AA39FG75_MICHY|nr:hypothetical protein PV327_002676 [Microctonus hyperodae]